MGLDMYIFRVDKPDLSLNKVYSPSQLDELGVSYITEEDAKSFSAGYEQLMPYTAKCVVENSYYDVEKIIQDYDLPSNSGIGMISYEKIVVSGRTRSGEYKRAEVSHELIDEKYTLTKKENCIAWKSTEVAYWRKAYDVQDFIHQQIDCDVENCGHYELDKGQMEYIYSLSPEAWVENFEPETGSDTSGFFYHEWY